MRDLDYPLRQVIDRIRAIETSGPPDNGNTGHTAIERVTTGWPMIDTALGGGLAVGAAHEWFHGEAGLETDWQSRPTDWHPPLGLLMHLARQAMTGGDGAGWCVWIGRRCRPFAHGLAHESMGREGVLGRSLWVDPPDAAGRLWAVDLAARCRGVRIVVADGSGLDMAATRRLQLAAEAGGTLVLLTRPMSERKVLSAAATRWQVTPRVSDSPWPRWELELLRCKGLQRGMGMESQRTWLLERTHQRGEGFIVAPAEPGDRPATAATPAPIRQRA